MAKGSNLIFQGMTGKLGGIIISRYADGDTILRTKPTRVRQPNTEGQIIQKSKFAATVEIARLNKNIIRAYTKPRKVGVSAYSSFVGTNVKNATTNVGTAVSVLWEQIRTVTGGGADVYGIDVSAQNNAGTPTLDDITLTWTYDANNPTHNTNDRIGIVVIDKSIGVIMVNILAETIDTETATTQVPISVVDSKFIIPFVFFAGEGYGAETGKYVLQAVGAGPTINNR